MNNPYLDRISVTKITPINKGTIKAFASIKLGSTLSINSIKIIQQAGQRAFVRLPESEKDGKYYPVVSADDKQFQEAVQEKVLAAWEIDAGFGARGK